MTAAGLKICGVVRAEDAAVCRDLGVTAVGLNFWSGSRRVVTDAAATAVCDVLRGGDVLRIGVFVDPEPRQVSEVARRFELDAIQLHGDAPLQPYAALGLPYVMVIRGTPALPSVVVPSPPPRWILLDAAVAGYGGGGVATDWTWARAAVSGLGAPPGPGPVPVWLAGGLRPQNAGRALQATGAAGLDVASGSEADPTGHPGIKDPEAIAALWSICQNRVR